MAKESPGKKKSTSAPSKKKTASRSKKIEKKAPENIFSKIAGSIFLLLLFVGFSAILVDRLVPPAPSKPDVVRLPVPEKQVKKRPAFEIYPTDVNGQVDPDDRPILTGNKELPTVAIIIDDIGYSKEMADNFADLSMPITFSILPNSPNYRPIATRAYKKGIEIMLHLPMEPMEYPKVDPGPEALLESMTPDQLIGQLNRHIERMPYIVGVNNHMGSRLTSVSTKMYQVFSILKKRDLFFIDSRTSVKSLCKPSARLLQLSFAQRDVFLDHTQTTKAVNRQILRLIKVAKKQGYAIGIGHPHQVTFDALKKALPLLESKVRLVKASELVHPLG